MSDFYVSKTSAVVFVSCFIAITRSKFPIFLLYFFLFENRVESMATEEGRLNISCLFIGVLAVLSISVEVASVAAPSSRCYAIDNSSRLVDFSRWAGHNFEYDSKNSEPDLAVRFCKDVEARSQEGYIDFGRFDKYNYFKAGAGHVDFVQGFYHGDLVNCEDTYDKMGRTAQVNIVCGGCSNGHCTGGLGCICNITYESSCRALIELTMPCEKPGPRIFQGFTVGFHPRSWEVVHNGITQQGFEKVHHDFSFLTEQTNVALYMTAVASYSSLVQKPILKVIPEHGLDVRLSGSGATGKPPTTLSPTILLVDWKCKKVRSSPYEVNISIPVNGYEPIEFVLTKMCESTNEQETDAARGWATFGIVSCVFMVSATLFCCGGFIYKTRVQQQHGIDALPGTTILSACLEAVSGGGRSYSRPQDRNSTFASEASWERRPDPSTGKTRPSDRRYGAI